MGTGPKRRAMTSKFIYQVYPKSFLDTTGNGIGDLRGVTKKVKYIKDLGFDYLWLTPFFVSPQIDNGYDVEDYLKIDPLFGTMSDFEDLVVECQKFDLQIMLDMVLNHSSINHKWFHKALKGSQKHQEYYVFKDKPNTWQSKFGSSAWQYVDNLDLYYLHLFDVTQADFNWENEKLREKLFDIVNFWLDKGVDGFRFDVINLISKDQKFENGVGDGRFEYTDGPRIHEYLKLLNQNTFGRYPNTYTVGEMSSTSIDACKKYANKDRSELDCVFNFHHLKVDYKNLEKWNTGFFDFIELKKLLSKWQETMINSNSNMALFWSNHDQPRIASRFIKADTNELQICKSKMLAVAMYLHQGDCFVFQGEEIGMINPKYTSIEQYVDIESKNYYAANQSVEAIEVLNEKSRDNSRTIMQWDDSKYRGFSTIKPWLSPTDDSKWINVESQLNDEDSVLNFYKKLIALKKSSPCLNEGSYKCKLIDDPNLYVYERYFKNVTFLVICNFTQNKVDISSLDLSGEIVIDTCNERKMGELPAFGAVVVRREDETE